MVKILLSYGKQAKWDIEKSGNSEGFYSNPQ